MLKRISLALLSSLFMLASLGQSASITGTVQDSTGKKLPGVAVVLNGSKVGSITDLDGQFKINVPNPNTAVFTVSFIGYKTTSIAVKGRTQLTVILKENAAQVGEVVVIGYGKSSKKEFTGAISTVKGENIEKLNIPRVDQALQGQIAGVNINTNSGSPGGTSSIRIRGISTFGDNDPLILVDGIVYDSEGLNALNPNDIASINVLKDATAGIYGVRAANGVILIETKKGKINAAPKFTVSGYTGVQQAAKKLSLLNASEYAVLKNEMFANGGDDLPFNNTQLGEGTNWQDSVFSLARVSSYNIGVTGGSNKTTYSIGGSYFSQDGIVGLDKSNFTRINARVNLKTEMSKKLNLTSVFLYTNEERNILPENGIGSVLYNTINAFPTDAIRDVNGNYTYLEEVSDIINPLAQMANTFNTSHVHKFVGKEEIGYQISDHLSFTNRLNYNFALVDDKVFSPLVWYGPGKAQNTALNEDLDPTLVEIAAGSFIERGASIYEQRATYSDLNYESFLNHDIEIKKVHKLKTTLGFSMFVRSGEAVNGTGYNIPNNSLEYADVSANTAAGGYLNNVGSFQYQERLISQFIRTEYQFKNRYFLSGILRRDGSSKFGPNNRFGTFPTISASWVMSDESFYKVNRMKFLKLRMSYGISGNDQIGNFAYRGLLNGEGVYVFDDLIVQGVAIGRASNPDLKWETTRQFNIGADVKFFKQFDFTVNYFVKKTKDLLFQPEVSAVLGTAGAGSFPPIVNAGDVSNKGVELDLKYHTKRRKKWRLSTGINATFIKNTVDETPEGVDFITGAGFGVGGGIATRFEKNYPIGYFIGYETDGVFQTQFEIDNAEVVQEGAKPGDLKYVDQNGDGKISFSDDSDKKMLGSPIPKVTLGYNLVLSYKAFDLSANLFASLGQEIIRNYERQQPYANQLDYNINRWNGPGTSFENPRLTTDLTRNTVFSDFYVENGSFLRVRNVQIGYTLPKALLKRVKISSTRIYISANNLLTVTKYQGFDPEIGTPYVSEGDVRTGAGSATLANGIDNGFYPQARTFMAGLSITF